MVCNWLSSHENDYYFEVLILILLEYGLQPLIYLQSKYYKISLNPYSTGIWSATQDGKKDAVYFCEVLILILLEYGLQLI